MANRERPAGDVDYERLGAGYAHVRRPDPRIAARVHAALGSARTVLNVGAGAGSYEPADRYVLAVEPSAAMRAQRPAGAAPALDATVEHLPFDDDAFDAAMAMVTVHQWRDVDQGLRVSARGTTTSASTPGPVRAVSPARSAGGAARRRPSRRARRARRSRPGSRPARAGS
ncbi:hypothetical protein CTKZ_07350 [Cellulomonas algicola]|uniref:Methyltransferase type 11 domain-containing protein n=1 Tax=Cellulomonas algicola TaxID=2071633 RepID=A0A401UWW7_9CELL|nr:methyltransferase domain-containing protein [Cellulomonas algicola]GCD19173.1 hypothetical protein CTKZ_07350 [Cellulomonas algicola]